LVHVGGFPPVTGAPPPTSSAPAYICPMCPEVRSAKPDACPSCGMALEAETPASASRIEYLCPMHPDVSQDHPGACPKCGMELEPRTVSAAANPELAAMTRRLRVCLAFGLPLLVLAMLHMATPMRHGLNQHKA